MKPGTSHKNLALIMLVFMILLASGCNKYDISDDQSVSFLKFFGSYLEDTGNDVKQDNDGGYVLVGTSTTTDQGKQMFLVKTDPYGNEADWSPRYFGGSMDDFGTGVEVLEDGYLLVGTATTAAGDKDIFLVRTDRQGNPISGFPKTIGGPSDEEGNFLLINSVGGLLIVGSTNDPSISQGKKDILLVHANVSGDSLWARSFGGAEDDIGNGIAEVENGYVILGTTHSFPGSGGQFSSDVMLVRTNLSGRAIFAPTIGGGTTDETGEYLFMDGSGNGAVIGTSFSQDGSVSGIFLASLDQDLSLEIISVQSPDGSGNYTGKCVYADQEGRYFILGSIEQLSEQDIYFLGVDQDGNKLFSNIYGHSGSQWGMRFEPTSDGGYIVVGTNGFEGNSMVTLIKTGPEGGL